MHEAYDFYQLLNLTVQIESIAAYDEKLLVGTRQGHLLMYSVVPKINDQKHEVQLMRYCKTFSKKAIQQLDVNLEYHILVSLTDNMVSIHDINSLNFPMICQLPRTKGATIFTLNPHQQISMTDQVSVLLRMCVAVKRKLQLYYWKNNEFFPLDEITINDIPRALSWCEDTICVGFKGEYILYNLNGKTQELFPTGSNRSSEPSITKISEKMFALGRENQTVLVNTNGNAEVTKAVRWSDALVSLAYDEPYMLGLVNDNVEIQTVEPNGVIQTLTELNKARLICHCKQGLLYVASSTQLWCVHAVDVAKQRQQLLNDKQFQLAVKLTNISNESEEEKKEKIHQIQTLHAYDLFSNKKFKESMDEFLKLNTDPYDVIRLFPDLLPQQNVNAENQEQTTTSQKLQDRDLENGLLALIYYLMEVRVRTQYTEQSKAKANASGNLNDKGVMSKATFQLLQIIDTTLLKCYLQTNDALVAPLLRRNYCHLGETEKTLKKHHKYVELIILYNTKGQHKKALELLQKQADQMDSSLRGYDKSIQYLQHLGADHINLIFEFAGWILDAKPEEGLKIFTEDILEVEHLPRPKVLDYLLRTHVSLVIPYLEHVVHTWEDSNPLFSNVLIYQYKERLENQQSAQAIKMKLLKFLESSTNYSPDDVIKRFPNNAFLEERALILGKMNQHRQVLLIYIAILDNVDLAIKYCDKVQSKDDKGESYIMLIKMLLFPPTKDDLHEIGIDTSSKQLTRTTSDMVRALEILNSYADKINPIKILSVLPDGIHLSQIKHFLTISLEKAINDRRRSDLFKHLLTAENDCMDKLKILHENQSILLTEVNVCPVCKKRFGNQSAFVRYPNGDVVHFSCQDKRF